MSALKRLLSKTFGDVSARHRKYGLQRWGLAECPLEKDYLRLLWHSQNGRCHYSGIQMQAAQHTHWGGSLERLNLSRGYEVGNVQWICRELNIAPYVRVCGSKKMKTVNMWSREKVQSLPCKKAELVSPEAEEGLEQLRIRGPVRENEMGNTPTLRGEAARVLLSSRIGAKNRRCRGRDVAGIHTIKWTDVCEMLESQGLRCAYSNIPFGHHRDMDWRMSIERVNNQKGYTPENCVLICKEFNSADHTGRARCPDKVTGSAQMSREKVTHLVEHVLQDLVKLNDPIHELTAPIEKREASGDTRSDWRVVTVPRDEDVRKWEGGGWHGEAIDHVKLSQCSVKDGRLVLDPDEHTGLTWGEERTKKEGKEGEPSERTRLVLGLV
uniref:Uncharacterized protein n=1 Tax=Chromera velia CCMP2878 TaxID=1169474 RepID=A0A0G4GSP2_9ALVE|eukprot:Cvel_5153.t1-p1 / transcript=Cvel_5153.t1 / gene=Cvel_5153 / organism=Chromera_velia_CCMP2878 / gene_product=hypothetical protein / transcript_product=hypothetical protein / location=Cvel_scaffold236:38405-40393(+) / protein_length=381 / sequence_SO=supercontig / SO=protein_coding / is_pseudo=false